MIANDLTYLSYRFKTNLQLPKVSIQNVAQRTKKKITFQNLKNEFYHT